MKKLIPLLFLGLIATFLPSCCGFGGCGTVSPAVLKRATAQNGTGEPHIGTIPTMKVLAE
ncbi:hypothetical protein N9294_02030 [bacterium]|nr:hypothetical protein [bacterium]